MPQNAIFIYIFLKTAVFLYSNIGITTFCCFEVTAPDTTVKKIQKEEKKTFAKKSLG